MWGYGDFAIHRKVAKIVLPKLSIEFLNKGVELRGCKKTLEVIDATEAQKKIGLLSILAQFYL